MNIRDDDRQRMTGPTIVYYGDNYDSIDVQEQVPELHAKQLRQEQELEELRVTRIQACIRKSLMLHNL
jgi:hypothetical protein